MSPCPGEVWQADLGQTAKNRPIVIVSREDPDAPRSLAIYVPLTTQNRGSKYEVVLPKLHFLREDSVANVQGVASVKLVRLERKLGNVPDDVLDSIRKALLFALDIRGT
jgi:mRNA interferase MazF